MSNKEETLVIRVKNKDFLLADFEYFSNRLLHNEDIGEKRFNFFITLVAAVVGGSATVYAQNSSLLNKHVLCGGLFGLIVFGFLTYFRLRHRECVKKEYQDILDNIRKVMYELEDAQVKKDCLQYYNKLSSPQKNFKGSYLESVAVVNFILVCTFFYLLL